MTTLSKSSDGSVAAKNHRPRATMREVAALAGVSLKTVSRVVNREAGVSPDLVARVERATSQLDYRHNLAASNLRRAVQRTGTWGLLLADVANPFFANIHRGVEDVARPNGIVVLAASMDEDPDIEQAMVREFSARRVDGMIMASTASEQSYLAAERRAGLPVVFVDRRPMGFDGDLVESNNRQASKICVRSLLDIGHRRIGFIGGVNLLSTAEDRYLGFLDAMSEADAAVLPHFVERPVRTSEHSAGIIDAFLAHDEPPTAIYCAQNLITMGAVRALRKVDRQHEIALMGFDDFPLADLLDPGVTVMAQDPRRMGQYAAELLLSRVGDPYRLPATTVVATQLIKRGSGEIRPPRGR